MWLIETCLLESTPCVLNESTSKVARSCIWAASDPKWRTAPTEAVAAATRSCFPDPPASQAVTSIHTTASQHTHLQIAQRWRRLPLPPASLAGQLCCSCTVGYAQVKSHYITGDRQDRPWSFAHSHIPPSHQLKMRLWVVTQKQAHLQFEHCNTMLGMARMASQPPHSKTRTPRVEQLRAGKIAIARGRKRSI